MREEHFHAHKGCRHSEFAHTYTYVLLSLAFIIVNIFTLSNLVPWIDEVMFLDTSYNAAFHGSWETTAWYRVAGQYPFSTYPPLYQMLASVWMRLFGGSMVTVRSLNLLITFVLGIACLRLMKRHGLAQTPWVTALFTMQLWGTSEMAWMYRNGRPDMLCALVFVITIHSIDNHLLAKTSNHLPIYSLLPTTRLSVIISSALLVCSGIQAAVYLCGLWLFFFFVIKGRRKEAIRLFTLLMTGILLGGLLVALFMLVHGRLVAFASSIIQYSTTLSSIVLAMLPWAGEVFGFSPALYTQKLIELNTASSFGERLFSIVEFHSFIILSFVTIVAYAICFRHNLSRLLREKGFLLLLFSLYVPFFMNLAGRFTLPYHWMAFLPLVVAVTSIAARYRLWSAIFGAVAVLLTVFGMRSMLPDAQWDYKNLRSFVQRQHFKPSDTVVCPFSTFYEMKPVCDTCYFVGIFPLEFLGHVDYIIETSDGDEYDQSITNYVNRLKADTTVVLTAIDHCKHPSFTLYQVQTKHE